MLKAESLVKLKSIGDQTLPPVEKWDPEYCGELNLQIKADGRWLYQGTPFNRKKMILLFSRIIKREENNYFLVTPVEKVSIQVEWMPFVIIDFKIIHANGTLIYRFFDNCDNSIDLIEPTQMSASFYQSQNLPIVKVRRNLFASFSRNCYYRLLSSANIINHNNHSQVVITSNHLAFSLGEYEND